jgi:hypothetical protein
VARSLRSFAIDGHPGKPQIAFVHSEGELRLAGHVKVGAPG